MAKELVVTAPSVEEAKDKLVEQLGVSVKHIRFEVICEPQKKALGLFGGADAQVKGTVVDSPADAAKMYLEDVLAGMGAKDFTVTIIEKDETCTLSIEGEDLGFVIGRRGETLDALQYLAGLIANRVDNSYYRINVDIGNYRQKREKTLVSLAKKMAGQAARTGRKTSLEPMNPYERRIIHTTVQEIEGATSWSIGSDASRHVVIGPSDDNPVKEQRARRRRRGGRADSRPEKQTEDEMIIPPVRRRDDPTAPGRPVRQFVPRSNPLPMADGASLPQKTESEAEKTAFLYGRIDL